MLTIEPRPSGRSRRAIVAGALRASSWKLHLGRFALAGAALVGKIRKVKKNLDQPSPLRHPDPMAVICEKRTTAPKGVVSDQEGNP